MTQSLDCFRATHKHIFFLKKNKDGNLLFQIENFLSDIGGQLGLWLGVSILSGAEVVELLAMMLIYLITGKNNKNNSSTTSGDPLSIMEEGKLEKKTTTF